MSNTLDEKKKVYADGEPCDEHPHCLSHVRTACEGCGRHAGIQQNKELELTVKVDRLYKPMILRQYIGKGSIGDLRFEISMGMNGVTIIQFDDLCFVLNLESFIGEIIASENMEVPCE